MPKILRRLRIDEVSSVDRGAGEGVKIMLMKRRATRSHSMAAKLLGFFKEGDGSGDARSFDHAVSDSAAGNCDETVLDEIAQALDALKASVASILADDGADKPSMIEESFAQFKDHIADIVPDEVAKALAAGIAAAAGESFDKAPAPGKVIGEVRMSAAVKKALGLPETASDEQITAAIAKLAGTEAKEGAAVIAKLLGELAFAKMSEAHQDYAEKSDMSDDEKDEFAAMSPAERDEHIKNNPLQKSADEERIAKAERAAAEAQAQIAKLQDERTLAEVAKRIEAFGGDPALAPHLHAIAKAVPAAAQAIEAIIKGLAAQVRAGKVFAEFGAKQAGDATSAVARMNAAVAELRKIDPALGKKSDDYVIAKIAGMPQHAELWRAYKAETSTRAA